MSIAATVLYAAVGFLVPLAWIVLYRYLSRAPHLLTDPAAVGYARLGVRRSLTSVIVYPVAAALAFAEPLAALAAFTALPLYFIATVVRPLRSETSRPRHLMINDRGLPAADSSVGAYYSGSSSLAPGSVEISPGSVAGSSAVVPGLTFSTVLDSSWNS